MQKQWGSKTSAVVSALVLMLVFTALNGRLVFSQGPFWGIGSMLLFWAIGAIVWYLCARIGRRLLKPKQP